MVVAGGPGQRMNPGEVSGSRTQQGLAITMAPFRLLPMSYMGDRLPNDQACRGTPQTRGKDNKPPNEQAVKMKRKEQKPKLAETPASESKKELGKKTATLQ